jgi:hypothetical protein
VKALPRNRLVLVFRKNDFAYDHVSGALQQSFAERDRVAGWSTDLTTSTFVSVMASVENLCSSLNYSPKQVARQIEAAAWRRPSLRIL